MHTVKQAIIAPGLRYGEYPEKPHKAPTFWQALQQSLYSPWIYLKQTRAKHYLPFITAVNTLTTQYQTLGHSERNGLIQQLRANFSMMGISEEGLIQAFAMVKMACAATMQLSPFDTQLLAARIMFDGHLAEMATGEGKTLASGICAAVTALSGSPVHMITANDYLVQRDALQLTPLYAALGLTVGSVTQTSDTQARQHAYGCDITYVTAKELAFDYLRDHALQAVNPSRLQGHLDALSGQQSQTILRGLCVALLDEADSILLDEACVPLILSQAVLQQDQLAFHAKAMELASRLRLEQDFTLTPALMQASLTDTGKHHLAQLCAPLSDIWQNQLHREETLCLALAAQHLYHKDQHYLVRDQKIHIIDSITGRLAAGRVWSQGLHQMIELKEQCQPSNTTVTLSHITYQRFFQRYYKIGGMSGTLQEARHELWKTFGLRVISVPLRLTSQRLSLGTTLYATQAEVWQHVVARAAAMQQENRPVLIGTHSVAASEQLSGILQAYKLAHIVLNARQDAEEANIVAQAGCAGHVTVSTNMAGRGTDISLDNQSLRHGGLHVISCQHNGARRIDRQLLGRAARQGNPGSTETVIALESALFLHTYPAWLIKSLKLWAGASGIRKPQWLIKQLIRLPQLFAEAEQAAQRSALSQQDGRSD